MEIAAFVRHHGVGKTTYMLGGAPACFIIEQALILNTATPPASGSSVPVETTSETDDLSVNDTVGFVADFVSGEAPKDKKSGWEILGTRNRASLNQNFARELPLEYRATLKDYYEKVAK